jgi:hypothetical protein
MLLKVSLQLLSCNLPLLVLLMGAILGCRKAGLAMAAGMSLGRSPFLRVDSPSKYRGEVDERTATADMKNQRILEERKTLFAKVGNSDHSLLGTFADAKWLSRWKVQ